MHSEQIRADAIAVFPATVGRVRDYLSFTESGGRGNLISASALAGVPQMSSADTWFGELEGLRVLVIHPFAESIQRQYQRRHELFPGNPRVLPEFEELLTYIPVQSIQQVAVGWEESLTAMKTDIARMAPFFDIALLACGGWGHPLVGYIRHELHRSAIYVGGKLCRLL